ncbi:MAG: hypothetical protein B6I26_03715 [Desulfobacteraceae bacterium 4572_130]|nr:MAG: hypothetical protein B6I26_03715 [Desulfobacteraceae bacterium 4572_130]
MCLILFAYKVSKKHPFILAANRDEFYQRPTAPMNFWHNKPYILAGKDIKQGGTWFGINKKNKRFAGITNFRDPFSIKSNAPSRGEIIIDFLESTKKIELYINEFKKKADIYNGFNLVLGDKDSIFWFSNLKNKVEKIKIGIHGISNKFLNTPWPKITLGKKALHQIINENITYKSIFSMLGNRTIAHDTKLPNTGIGLKWERILSPLFIKSDIYGTRSSTIMLIHKNGNIDIIERTYNPENHLKYKDEKFFI